MSPATVRYLAALPFSLDVRAHGGHAAGPRLVLVHGTPTLNIVYWTADPSDEFCLEMAAMVGLKAGDAIAFGHTHKLWPRVVEGMHFIYTGGVGRPKDGHWRAGYVRLEPGEAEPRVEFVRITNAVESAARGVIDAGLPEEFAEILRAGGASERSQ